MEQNLDFESLKKNLFDVIKESQIKLGYAKTSIGFYYPLESLNRLLNSDLDEAGMSQVLKEFAAFSEKELGKILISCKNTRFCIRIPEEGVEYVHDKVTDTGFLEVFIEKIGHCNLSLDGILEVFYQYSNHVTCKKIESEDFNYVVYFEDGEPDDYRYCIKFEGGCAIYHRFTPKDYEAFGFEEMISL
ncbi:MAG: DUF3877 family protein [Lachnospiraceae bacterium]|nr:DUF3877 family protein [Lachnospiraceae bacterium]